MPRILICLSLLALGGCPSHNHDDHHHGDDSGMHHGSDGGMHHGDGGMHHGDGGMHHGDGGMHHGDGGMHHGDGGMHHGSDGGMHHGDGGMHQGSDGGMHHGGCEPPEGVELIHVGQVVGNPPLATIGVVSMSPAMPRVGNNELALQLLINGNPLNTAEGLRVTPFMPHHGHGTNPASFILPSNGDGEVDGEHRGNYSLDMPGYWTLSVTLNPQEGGAAVLHLCAVE